MENEHSSQQPAFAETSDIYESEQELESDRNFDNLTQWLGSDCEAGAYGIDESEKRLESDCEAEHYDTDESVHPGSVFEADINQSSELSIAGAEITKLKALVYPDEYTVDDDKELVDAGLVVNTFFKVIICLECGRAIDPSFLHSHLKNHVLKGTLTKHSVKKDLVTNLLLKYDLVDPKISHSSAFRPNKGRDLSRPIFGINILDKRIFCDGCHSGYKTPKSLANHQRNCSKKGTNSFRALTQTLFTSDRRAFFPVQRPNEQVSFTDDATLFLQSFPQKSLEQLPIDPKSHSRKQLDIFIRKEQWQEHLAGLIPSDLLKLVTLPEKKSPRYPIPLRDACLTYLNEANKKLDKLQQNWKQMLAKRSRYGLVYLNITFMIHLKAGMSL
jgi:hypothetical protein